MMHNAAVFIEGKAALLLSNNAARVRPSVEHTSHHLLYVPKYKRTSTGAEGETD